MEAEKSSAFDKGVSRAQTAASRKYARELKIELKKVKDSAEKELNKQKATANEALARANDENARRQKDIDGLKSELQKRSVEARELRRELDTLKLKPSKGDDDAVAEAKKASTMERKAARNQSFRAVNTVLGNIKTSIAATFHAGARKHAARRLAEFAWRVNRRYDLPAMIPRLGWICARTPPMPYRLLKLAEPHG